MAPLERQVRRALHRLWFNRWIACGSYCLTLAAGVFAAAVLAQRLYDVALPMVWVGVGIGAAALVGSIVWLVATRETHALAAAMLDEAAGLRERISSGQYCTSSTDPFERAVLADAERVVGSISVRRHIRLILPTRLVFSSMAMVVAALMFLVPVGVLASDPVAAPDADRDAVVQTKLVVKKKLDSIRKLAQTNTALEGLDNVLDGLEQIPGAELDNPMDVRHNAVKRIDKVQDALRSRRQDSKYAAVSEAKKMFRSLKIPNNKNAPTRKLAKALANGDFKAAREQISELKEMLATLKTDQDKALVAELSKQLENMAKQLEQAAKNKQLKQKLEQAGIKKEDLERLLNNLKKKDLDQLIKQLEKKGMSQQEISKIAKQLKQQQTRGATAKKLGSALRQASQFGSSGQSGNAIAGLSMAADQISELEQLELEMAQLDSTVADLQNAKNDLARPCSKCNGTGQCSGKACGKCNGSGNGPGMGGLGRGRGGLAPENRSGNLGWKIVRGKVHTGKGAIIGQVLIDGEQVKGTVSSKLVDVVTAARRDATDSVIRDRVPRHYQKAVRDYFSQVERAVGGKTGANQNDGQADGSVDDEQAPASGTETDKTGKD